MTRDGTSTMTYDDTLPTPKKRGDDAARRPSRWPGVLRALVLAAAAVVLCWPLTVGGGVVAAAVGGLAGALGADALARRRPPLRLAGALGLALLAFLLGAWGVRTLSASALFAGLLGPVAALRLTEAVRWFFLTAPVVFGLRFAARRRPLLALLEVLAVAVAVAASFAAHREGMVHRPLSIGDWAWSRGIDPAFVFLALGGLATLLLAVLLISEERRRRLPLHLSALFLVALVLLLVIRVGGLPKPQPAGDLGLTGDPEAETEADQEGEIEGRGGRGGQPREQLDDLEFKNEYGSSGAQAPVAVVVLHDDYSPPAGAYYFRQTVFSQYNGRRLVQATRDDVDRDVVRRFPAAPIEVAEAPPAGHGRRPLRTSVGLLIDHVRPFGLDSPVTLRPIPNPNPLRFQRAFEVRSHVQTLSYEELIGRRPGNPEWTPEQWEHYTEAPRDPRYFETAEEQMDWLRPEYAGDPLAQALAIKSYLDENGVYSRRSRHADGPDPVSSFLFGDLTGYCVHFAHAATYLFRSLGLPARVAAGYAVAEASRGTGSSIMIRGADAHAWPEVYLEGVGWVVVDVVPQTTLEEPTESPDQELQRMLGEMMRQGAEEEGFEEASAFDFSVLRWLVLILLLALLLLAYLIKLGRSLAPRFAAPHDRHRYAYRAALDRFADVGVVRRFGESREGFARRSRELAPSFADLTERHLGSALGSRRRADGDELRALATATRRELRRLPAWRRWLGWLNPVSWIWAR